MAIGLPNPPTDNLYKFMAISGIIIMLATLGFFFTYSIKLDDKLFSIKEERALLEYEVEILEYKLAIVEKKFAHFGEKASKFENKTKALKKKLSEVKTKPTNAKLKDLSEESDLLLKEMDVINKEREVYEKEMKLILDELEGITKETKIRAIKLKHRTDIHIKLNSMMTFLKVVSSILIFFGSALAFLGFNFWYYKTQKLLDEILAKQLIDYNQQKPDNSHPTTPENSVQRET